MEIIDQINKYGRLCFWRGNDLNKKGNSLAAWSKVQKPKSQGGFGVIHLAVQNRALLFKHLHKIFNKQDIPWVDLTWKAYYIVALPPPMPPRKEILGAHSGGGHCVGSLIILEAYQNWWSQGGTQQCSRGMCGILSH
jgi:hypothetical protein